MVQSHFNHWELSHYGFAVLGEFPNPSDVALRSLKGCRIYNGQWIDIMVIFDVFFSCGYLKTYCLPNVKVNRLKEIIYGWNNSKKRNNLSTMGGSCSISQRAKDAVQTWLTSTWWVYMKYTTNIASLMWLCISDHTYVLIYVHILYLCIYIIYQIYVYIK